MHLNLLSRRLGALALTGLATLWMVGCANPTAVDRNFGMAVRQAQTRQTLDPNAASQPRPQADTDAATVRASIVRYEKTYATPPSSAMGLELGLGSAGTNTGSGAGQR